MKFGPAGRCDSRALARMSGPVRRKSAPIAVHVGLGYQLAPVYDKEGTAMKLVSFSARLAQRAYSRVVARTAVRRRFVVFSVTMAAVVASVALTAGPASASFLPTATSINAVPQEVYPGGAIDQWDCDSANSFAEWTTFFVGSTPYGNVFEIQNVGALDYDHAADCLDADAQQVYPGGAVIQWGCDSSDPYQLWLISAAAGTGPVLSLQNYGALLQGAASCVDADAGQIGDGGAVFQWGCNILDAYQVWYEVYVPGAGDLFENYATA
jgi:hypothetical protein